MFEKPTPEDMQRLLDEHYSVDNVRYLFKDIGIKHERTKTMLVSKFIKRELTDDDSLEELPKNELMLLADGLAQMLVDEELMGVSDIMQRAFEHQRECYKQDKQEKK